MSSFRLNLLITGSNAPKRDYRFIEISSEINKSSEKLLTQQDVEYDIEQTMYALETAYSGSRFLPLNEFNVLLENIRSIRGPMTVKDFCYQIGGFVDKVTALLISITSFYQSTSPAWNGFLEKVKGLLPQAQLVIIDMRGNGGGDDAKGFELSTLLAGNPLKHPYGPQWNSYRPETYQLFVNTFDYWGRLRKDEVKKYQLILFN